MTNDPLQITVLARRVGPRLRRARRRNAQGRIGTWDVAREILRHAVQPEVRAAAEAIKPTGAGRPRSPHVIVMEALAKEAGIGHRTLYRWVSEWQAVAEILHVHPSCTAKEFSATMAENSTPERVEELLDEAFPELQDPEPEVVPDAAPATHSAPKSAAPSLAPSPEKGGGAVPGAGPAAKRTIERIIRPPILRCPPGPWEDGRWLIHLSNLEASRILAALELGIRVIEVREHDEDELDAFPTSVRRLIEGNVTGRLALVHPGRLGDHPVRGRHPWAVMCFPARLAPTLDPADVAAAEREGWEILPCRTFRGTWHLVVMYDVNATGGGDLAAIAPTAALSRMADLGFGSDDNPHPPVLVVPQSHNAKTGAIACTYVSQATCSSDCLYKNGGGCYAEHGPMAMTTRRVNSSPITDPVVIARMEADAIDHLPADVDLRVHVVGDCLVPAAAQIVGAAMVRYETRSPNGSRAWTYTHSWRSIPNEAWQGANVLASCETADDVREAQERGYTTCIVVRDDHPGHRRYEYDGIDVVPCPAETRDVPCTQCRLCMRPDKLRAAGVTISFSPHGVGQGRVRETLRAACSSCTACPSATAGVCTS